MIEMKRMVRLAVSHSNYRHVTTVKTISAGRFTKIDISLFHAFTDGALLGTRVDHCVCHCYGLARTRVPL